jgi:betaine reductase
MSHELLRAVHYLNQFFGQIGGEDKADVGFSTRDGPVGPGIVLQKDLAGRATIVTTIICGDNYLAGNPRLAIDEGLQLVEAARPHVFIAGPAFEAGRYGIACGAMCRTVKERLAIPVVTGMYQENPGVQMYHRDAFICRTGGSARNMANALQAMARLALRLVSNEPDRRLVSRESLPLPEEYDYFPRGIVRNVYTDKAAAERAVDKLLAKVRGQPFESEVALPSFERVPAPPPLRDLSTSEIALVSDGGLVPRGNPDGLSGRGNLRWTTYELDAFFPVGGPAQDYEVAHTGYFADEVLGDPNRLVPVDVLRELVAAGSVGKLHSTFFCTSGNATVARRCAQMGSEMGAELAKRGVDAVILTST